jgi:hypothetical protein
MRVPGVLLVSLIDLSDLWIHSQKLGASHTPFGLGADCSAREHKSSAVRHRTCGDPPERANCGLVGVRAGRLKRTRSVIDRASYRTTTSIPNHGSNYEIVH